MKTIKQLKKEYEKESKKCVKNAYDPEKDEWNKEHFNRCDGDVIAGKLEQTESIKKMIEKDLKYWKDVQNKLYNEDRKSNAVVLVGARIEVLEKLLSKIEGEEK